MQTVWRNFTGNQKLIIELHMNRLGCFIDMFYIASCQNLSLKFKCHPDPLASRSASRYSTNHILILLLLIEFYSLLRVQYIILTYERLNKNQVLIT